MVLTLPFLGTVNVTRFVVALGLFVVLAVGFRIIHYVVTVRLRALAKHTNTSVDDVVLSAVGSIRPWVYTLVAFYVALMLFTLPHTLNIVISSIVLVAVAWQIIEVGLQLVEYAAKRFFERDEDGDGQIDPNAATASNLFILISRIALWSFGIIFVLSNLGIQVTSLIAGLGIGGVAVAFALQGVLGDLFASFSIYLDRPFRIGDYIMVGADSGTVEKIGIKTTRIRTLQGEELVVSNNELTTTRVQNFKKMQERRIASQFGVLYETPLPLVKEIPDIVRAIFADIDGARLDRVHFTTFGDSALLFDVVYYIESADYTQYLDRQQRFNLELMERFAAKGIEFAYPTQTIYTKTVA